MTTSLESGTNIFDGTVFVPKKQDVVKNLSSIYSHIDFESIKLKAFNFAYHIKKNQEDIIDILLEYETFEVAQDEIERTLDLLLNLEENKKYFVLRVGEITSFLPRNQPLYALACFVLIPSLMATGVHFRVPHTMRKFFPTLLKKLKMSLFFPNVIISNKERHEFLQERTATYINSHTEETLPITDVVIFTGTSFHAEKLRFAFDKRTLFISNGSGHNPIVIAHDANIEDAVDAVLKLQLYNQGQDCANPNAILVHKDSYENFIRKLRIDLKKIKVGGYRDRQCRVGPISQPDDLIRIQMILVDNRDWLDPTTPGVINTSTAIVEPTIISKPLKEGGNFTELFSPIVFVQKYDNDNDLSLYFEDNRYAPNSMYVSLYGTSSYIENIINRPIRNKILHDQDSVLHNIHLHAQGIERGTKPYGGNGFAASSLSINGEVICKATLPQRDIYEHIARPLIDFNLIENRKTSLSLMDKIIYKDVQKFMGIKNLPSKINNEYIFNSAYIDSVDLSTGNNQRYIKIENNKIFVLLDNPNIEHISVLNNRQISLLRNLCQYIQSHDHINISEFSNYLYALPKNAGLTPVKNRKAQLEFFQNIYLLLFGKNSGPRLAQFLVDAEKEKILKLLSV